MVEIKNKLATKKEEQTIILTKKELSDKIKKEVGKVKSRLPAKKDLDEFNQWKINQQNFEESLNLRLLEAKEKSLQAEMKLKEANIIKKLVSQNIDVKVCKLLVDQFENAKDVDERFEEVLAEYDFLNAKVVKIANETVIYNKEKNKKEENTNRSKINSAYVDKKNKVHIELTLNGYLKEEN